MVFDDWRREVFRYCPKCGAAALRFVGRKLIHCNACGFEWFLNAAAAVAALIFDERERLLLIERGREPGKGLWDLPGGFVDPGESAEEALRREVREELGLEVASLRYVQSLPNDYAYHGVRYATLDLGFVCEATDASRARAAEDEIAAVVFKRRAEIEFERFAFPSIRRLVERCFESPGATPAP
jgi:NADH pyrophosphatase NudC (nudix superfamily)